VQFFRFPKDEIMKRKWIQQCGLTELPGKAPRICSVHFNESDIVTGGKSLFTLNVNAFPVFSLGMIYKNSNEVKYAV